MTWTLLLSEGQFAGLEFSVPDEAADTGREYQITKSPTRVTYVEVGRDVPSKTLTTAWVATEAM